MVSKKILVDLERLRYPNSGLANVCRNLALGFSDVVEPQIYLYLPGSQIEKLNTNLKIKKWNYLHKFFAPFLCDFDVIHTTHQLSSYFHKKYKNSIKILTLHDLNFLHENLTESKRQKMLKKVNKNLKNTDYLVCISHFVKEDVLKNKHLLEMKNIKDIFVVHNGIELPENRLYDLGRFDFLKDKKYILNIGVLFEKKNQHSIIEMLPFIEEDLVLVASEEKEPYSTEIKNRISELKLSDRVHFLNNISEEEKYALIQNCEAMLHPSLAEGFGIPPIEAMAFGKPVFLSKLTSLPEIGGEYAFYFDDFEVQKMLQVFKKGMEIYWQNPEIYSQNVKNWVKQFDYRIMAKNYLEIYNKIIELNKL